ncbi:hypothetical protein EPUS_04115 [Endocarpon pusillum Z07020]|uniref:Zn(2)-C6 fungal-type domain-containing protein n=1 Tax=Endocarpon pusillum (strain Z07020 / HMAS-L-300199) TaxID=1263415 RepID=U1G7T1_ENDPU|nr:uncharacterized protein EPUS_04115 [Endocarpon pusillum Z07020]ERF73492.1 hypothetical protein EPUS_04115 [Endocarpon pusillum Z07020]
MSSFPSGIPSTKSEPGVQSARDVEPTTASLSLPPLHSIDPLQRFTPHPSQDPGLSKGLPPPGLPPISQYHRPQLPGISQYHITSSNPPLGHGPATGHPAGQVDGLPHPTTSLPIAPSGSHRLLSGGRHKKEVKRRTKTGCMTCRRRRIKCDEEQPSCRNCSKSKRECLGYDPIFKSQRSAPSLPSLPSLPSISPSNSTPASSASAPSLHLGSFPKSASPINTFSPTSKSPSPSSGPIAQSDSASGDHVIPSIPDIQGQPEQAQPEGLVAENNPLSVPSISQILHHPVAERVHVKELFNTDGQMAPPVTVSRSDDVVFKESVEAIYNTVYAPALDRFLETRWYTMSGLNALRMNSHMLAEFIAFVRAASLGAEESPFPGTLAQETRLIWGLLNICSGSQVSSREITESSTELEVLPSRIVATSGDFRRPPDNDSAVPNRRVGHDDTQNPQHTNTQSPPTNDYGSKTVITTFPGEDTTTFMLTARLKALYSLLTNNPTPQSSEHPLIPPSSPVDTPLPKPLARQLQTRQDEFWFCVGRFVAASRDADSNPDTSKAEMKTALHRARTLLDGFENRDVVYTVMRMRFLQREALDRDRKSGGEAAARLADEEMDEEEEEEKERDWEREWEFCTDILKNEAGLADGGDGVNSGTGKNVVAMRIAGMAVAAFELSSES